MAETPTALWKKQEKLGWWQRTTHPQPDLGMAFVLLRRGQEPRIFPPGEQPTAGERRWETLYEVDVTPHRFEFTYDIPSKADTFIAAGNITYAVANAVEIIKEKIETVTEARRVLESRIRTLLEDLAHQHPDLGAARDAMRKELLKVCHAGLKIHHVDLRLNVGRDTQRRQETIRKIEDQIAVEAKSAELKEKRSQNLRKRFAPIVGDDAIGLTVLELIAEDLDTLREEGQKLLRMRAEKEAFRLRMFEHLLDKGIDKGWLEHHDLEDIYAGIMQYTREVVQPQLASPASGRAPAPPALPEQATPSTPAEAVDAETSDVLANDM